MRTFYGMEGPPLPETFRQREVAGLDCYLTNGTFRSASSFWVKEEILKLYEREGTVRLDKPGCQMIKCELIWGRIKVCWEPKEGAPEVYEVPWTYVADYAAGIVEEWCGLIPMPQSPGYRVHGKAWDPKGLAAQIVGAGGKSCEEEPMDGSKV